MSTTVDRRVVEMRFDNQQFESRTRTTLGTLEKLKNALNFSHANDGLDKLSKSVGNLNMNPLRAAVDGVQVSFSKMEAVALTALANITNRVVDAGIALAKNLTIDQLSAGWQKYADKTTAVQTIMAATKNQFTDTAEQMQYVNEQLDRLNWFTDETSYNFVDMVSNIGKFTSNNIKLDTAATAMQGIATWAAVSGQNATTASRAMYQLSQALGTGRVQLMDWKSIETANMATYEFKEMALETATALGILKKQASGVYKTVEDGTEITIEGFRDSLKQGWFTSDVLMKTLEQYGGFTNKLYEVSEATGETATGLLQWIERYRDAGEDASTVIQDMAKATGLSVDELQGYMAELTDKTYELGEKAFRAAQEAKTFQEAIDATKDAVSTGWMNTFEIIFGDYEEARVRWTALANELWDIFASGAEARNELLEEALGLPESIVREQTTGWGAIEAAIEAAGVPLDEFIQRCLQLGGKDGEGINSIEDFKKSLNEGWLTGDIVAKAIDSFIGPIETAGEVTEAVGHTFEDFKRIVDETWLGKWGNETARWNAYTAAGWNCDAMQEAVNKSGKKLELTYEDYQAALAGVTDEQLKAAGYTDEQIQQLRDLQAQYQDVEGSIENVVIETENLKTGSELLFGGISQGWDAIKGIFSAMKKGWDIAFPPMTPERLYDILAAFNDVTERFDNWVGNWDTSEGTPISETVQNIADTVAGLGSVLGIGLDAIKETADFLADTFGPTIGGTIDKILDFTAKVGRYITSLRTWIRQNNIVRKTLVFIQTEVGKLIDSFTAWFVSFEEIPLIQRLIKGVKDAFSSLGRLIENTFPNATKRLNELWNSIKVSFNMDAGFTGVIVRLKSFGEALKTDILASWEKIKQSDVFGAFARGIESIVTALKTLDPSALTDWAKSTWNGVKAFFQPILDFFSMLKGRLFGYATDINSGFKTIGDVIADAVTYLKDHLGSIVVVFAGFLAARSIYNFANTLIGIAKAITAPVQTVVSAFSAFSSAAKGFSKAFKGLAILETAGAIAGLAYVAVKLGEIPDGQLLKGVTALGLITFFVVALLGIVGYLFESKSKLNGSFVKGQVSGMFKMVELAGAVMLLAIAFEKVVNVIKTSTTDQLKKALFGIIGAVGVLFILSVVIGKFGGKSGPNIAAPMVAIGIAVYIIAAAFQDIMDALYMVPESRIKNAEKIIAGLIVGVGIISVLLGLVSKLGGNMGGSSLKIGGTLIAVAGAIKLLVSAFDTILGMDLTTWDSGKTGVLIGIIAAISAIMLALSKMPATSGMNGFGVLAVAGAIEILSLAIRTLASVDTGDIVKAIVAIGIMMGFIEIFVLLTRKGSELTGKSALVFIGLSVAILILSGAIALLSLLKEEDVLLGVVAISAMITAVGVMMFLSSIAGELNMKHFIGISIVIGTLTAAIVMMSFLDPNAVLMGTVAISAMLTACGIMMLLSAAAKGIGIAPFIGLVAVIAALTAAIWAIGKLDPTQVLTATLALTYTMGVFTLMSTVLAFVTKSMTKQGPMAIAALLSLTIVLATIALVLVILTDSIKDPTGALEISLSLALLFTPLAKMLTAVAALGNMKFSQMLKGLVGAIAIIGAIGGLSALLGTTLDENGVSGIKTAIEKGFPILRAFGQSIGEILGGILEGIFKIDLKPLIGQLMLFAGGMNTFGAAIKGVSFDEGTAAAIKAIGSTMLYLAGADILNAITKLFGGDKSSLADFAKDLPAFADALRSFGEKLGENFNADAVSKAANAAKDLTKMVNSLPTSGGWKAKILGDRQGLDEFGDSIINFADDLNTFSEKISEGTIDPDKISTVAEAASSLVDLINNLPAKDGWLQKIIGQPQDLETFGAGMEAFGTAVKNMCDPNTGIGSLTKEATKCIGVAATAGWKLQELEAALPDEPGFFEDIFGGQQDFESFGAQITSFAGALKAAVSSDGLGGLGDLASTTVDTAVDLQ